MCIGGRGGRGGRRRQVPEPAGSSGCAAPAPARPPARGLESALHDTTILSSFILKNQMTTHHTNARRHQTKAMRSVLSGAGAARAGPGTVRGLRAGSSQYWTEVLRGPPAAAPTSTPR